MIRQFKLPDLGEGLTESEIVSWNVSVGDTVSLNQVIAEVETAKALVQLPSPFAGTIAGLLVEEGATVRVGSPIVEVDVADVASSTTAPVAGSASAAAPAAASLAAAAATAEPAAAVGRTAVLVGYGPAAEGTDRPKRKVTTHRGFAAPAPRSRDVRATPPVRHLASELGIDLASVIGTGPGGSVVREDVRAAAVSGRASAAPGVKPAASVASVRPDGRETRTPIRGVRKATAAAMVASAFTAPHVTEFVTIDVTPAVELLERFREEREFAEAKPTMLALVAKAMCLAIARTPSVNSRWDEAAGEIVEFGFVNLGIAVATPRGLMVPNIRDADSLNLAALAGAINDLAATARAGETTPAALSGGTISITNVGVFGVDAGTPILNPGEAAILAMGAVRRLPWEFHGEIALRQVITLSLSFDHRLVDGEQGSRFLMDVARVLSEPGRVLAF